MYRNVVGSGYTKDEFLLVDEKTRVLHIPNKIKYCYCVGVSIEELSMGESLESLICDNNNIRQIKCNSKLLSLKCANNNINFLSPNESLEILDCSDNNIRSIEANKNLRVLICRKSNLNKIKLSNELIYLDCSYNIIYTIHLGYNLQYIDCSNNYISCITLHGDIQYANCSKNPLTSVRFTGKSNILYNDYIECALKHKRTKTHSVTKIGKICNISDKPIEFTRVVKAQITLYSMCYKVLGKSNKRAIELNHLNWARCFYCLVSYPVDLLGLNETQTYSRAICYLCHNSMHNLMI